MNLLREVASKCQPGKRRRGHEQKRKKRSKRQKRGRRHGNVARKESKRRWINVPRTNIHGRSREAINKYNAGGKLKSQKNEWELRVRLSQRRTAKTTCVQARRDNVKGTKSRKRNRKRSCTAYREDSWGTGKKQDAKNNTFLKD